MNWRQAVLSSPLKRLQPDGQAGKRQSGGASAYCPGNAICGGAATAGDAEGTGDGVAACKRRATRSMGMAGRYQICRRVRMLLLRSEGRRADAREEAAMPELVHDRPI